jgi:hypothetical protein
MVELTEIQTAYYMVAAKGELVAREGSELGEKAANSD